MKANIDGAFSAESGREGSGVVIRDSEGKVLSAWRHVDRAESAEEVEAMACKEAVELAAGWIRMPIVLESDCVNVVNALKVQGIC